MKKRTTIRISAFLLCLCCAFFTSCKEDDGKGYVFGYDIPSNPGSLDPQYASDRESYLIIGSVFEGLFRIGADGNAEKAMAESYTVSDDGLTYNFKLKQDRYWTDVNGFLIADPRIVDEPKVIESITYKELRELSYMGASVLHEAAIFPVRSAKIPINIRNTNDPSAKGTMIVAEDNEPPQHIITGIAGKKHFSVISIEKDEMNSEIGFLRRILTVLEANGMCFEHIPTGIDTMSIIVDGKDVDKTPDIVEKICEVTDPNHIEIENDLALIAIVGRGMKSKKGTATRIFAALSHADINIKMIDQGSSELNIIVGIHEADFEKAIKVIYDMFILSED